MDMLQPDTGEWESAWGAMGDALVVVGISRDYGAGEGWQYMGTDDDEGAHCFRNRNVQTPQGMRRVYVKIYENKNTPPEVQICADPTVIHAPTTNAYGVQPSKESATRHMVRRPVEGVDWVCTGNFDGFSCGSDADSGL